MTTFLAGEKLRASELNLYVPLMCRATSDLTKNASTTLSNVTGMSVSVVANSTYIFDGYLAYSSGATPDIKFAFTVPAGVTGHWTVHGLSTSVAGNIDAQRATALTTALAMGGDNTFPTLACKPAGYVVVAGTAGTIQLQMAQNTSNASNTILVTGSWLRFQKVA